MRTHHRRSAQSVRGEAARADLLTAARRLFAERGFDGTSIRAVTREAGANLGAVAYHFGSKSALYSRVLEDALHPFTQRVRAAADSQGTALERMLHVVEACFEDFEAHPDLPHLLLQEVAAGKKSPVVVEEFLRCTNEAVVELQVQGIADGSVRLDQPVLTALSVVSQPVVLSLVAPLLQTVGPLGPAKPATRRSMVEHAVAFVRAGLEPREDVKGLAGTA